MGRRRCALQKIVVLHALVINPVDVLDGMDGSVVLVLGVLSAVFLIAVDVVEDFVEVLLGMPDTPQQLCVELEDAGPVQVGIAFIIHADMLVEPVLHLVQLGNHIAIKIGRASCRERV